MGSWKEGVRAGARCIQPWAGPGSEPRTGLTIAVLKQRRGVVEAAEGRAALRHRPATASAGPPGPSPGPVPPPGPASRCHSNALRSSIPGSARPASDGRRRAWHQGHHPPGCPERGGGRDTPCRELQHNPRATIGCVAMPPRYRLVPPTTGAFSFLANESLSRRRLHQ